MTNQIVQPNDPKNNQHPDTPESLQARITELDELIDRLTLRLAAAQRLRIRLQAQAELLRRAAKGEGGEA